MAVQDWLAQIAVSQPGAHVGAFFDVDRTLVDGFTPAAHARDRIRRRQSSVGEMLGVVEAAVRYKAGRMRFEPLLVRAAGYLRGLSLVELERSGQRIFDEHNVFRLYPEMIKVVRAHQDRGHTVALSSSALTIHVDPVARHLGIEHVVCNHFELDDAGILTGDIARPIVWGRNKATRVAEFCSANSIALQHSYFYADGDEDRALLECVGNPRVVNARSKLVAHASARGWPHLRVPAPPKRGR